MTPEQVREQVDTIAQAAAVGDDEAAHSTEDDLYLDVLQHIADGATDAAELAREALKTRPLPFRRWCA